MWTIRQRINALHGRITFMARLAVTQCTGWFLMAGIHFGKFSERRPFQCIWRLSTPLKCWWVQLRNLRTDPKHVAREEIFHFQIANTLIAMGKTSKVDLYRSLFSIRIVFQAASYPLLKFPWKGTCVHGNWSSSAKARSAHHRLVLSSMHQQTLKCSKICSMALTRMKSCRFLCNWWSLSRPGALE